MPGFTKAQLAEQALDAKNYAWCNRCRLYWHKRGIRTHKHVGAATKIIVKFHIPPTPKPKKGDVVTIHPDYERFIDFLVEGAIKEWQEEQLGGVTSTAPPAALRAPKRRRRPAREPVREEPDYDVITVDQAIVRLGVSREEIMAAFEKASADADCTDHVSAGPALAGRDNTGR